MEPVLRAAAVYGLLMVVVRASGRRTLGETTTFDFVLLLIISEATQNAMIGEDYSLTNAFLVILTLITLDVGFSLAKRRWPRLDKWVDGVPTLLVEHGRPIESRMRRARVGPDDILEAARRLHGLERMAQVKYAILERTGGISIIPAEGHRDGNT
ncbi:DUF421 domain-containing protein [Tundrisphaera lichenicola]|uniref:DUF421 domain-containing protein n=1 Tax=Tundrisphaera lichenicola TaxID=2029860 RepID=UPI003EC0AD9A